MNEVFERLARGLDMLESFLDRDTDVEVTTSTYAIAHTITGGNVSKENLLHLLLCSLMTSEMLGGQMEDDYAIPSIRSEVQRMKAVVALANRRYDEGSSY